MGKARLEDFKAPVQLKLSALWASVMFLYVYGDYFNMYTPGKLEKMAAGKLSVGPAGDEALLAAAVVMAVPSMMIFLSLILPPLLNRALNVLLGLAYSAIIVLTLAGAPPFYALLSALEIALTLLIVWHAILWPRA